MTRTPAPMPPMEDLHRHLRQWAAADRSLAAGVELLIRSGLAFRGDLWETAGWWDHEDHTAGLDLVALGAAVRDETLPLSKGEGRVLAVAASLIGAAPVTLAVALDVDRRNTVLVLAALSQAAGADEWTPGSTAWPL